MFDERLDIERIEFTKPQFGYTLYDSVYTCRLGIKSHRLKINVFADSEIPAGKVNEKMRLYTNNAEFPMVEIPINGYIKPRIEISPESIILRNLSQGQEVKREIVIRAIEGTIILENVQLKHPWLKVLELKEDEEEVSIVIGGKVPRRTLQISNRIMMDRAILEIRIKEPDPYATSIEMFTFFANMD
jgi:hypothetical protein